MAVIGTCDREQGTPSRKTRTPFNYSGALCIIFEGKCIAALNCLKLKRNLKTSSLLCASFVFTKHNWVMEREVCFSNVSSPNSLPCHHMVRDFPSRVLLPCLVPFSSLSDVVPLKGAHREGKPVYCKKLLLPEK